MTERANSALVFDPPIGGPILIWPNGHNIRLSDYLQSVRKEMTEQELQVDEACAFVSEIHRRIDSEEL